MDISEFNRLINQMDEDEVRYLEEGVPFTPALWMDYQNNQGERKQFRVINITSSPYYGCFEAECFSNFQAERYEMHEGDYNPDMGVTSHRTFKISNIISARICYV